LGEYISALSNAACLYDQQRAYLLYGIEDKSRSIIGTSFSPNKHRVKNQELKNWLDTQLKPGIVFIFHELFRDGLKIVIVEIYSAFGFPVSFKNECFIRVGTYKKKLKDHLGQERQLWEKLSKKNFDVLRFLDHPPKSRNEQMGQLMRRMGICEERGSGVDKVVSEAEFFQLPAPNFEKGDDFTRVTLYSHQKLGNMDKTDKVRAAYQHASLKYISRDFMTNTSLRKRFNIPSGNYPTASRIISDSVSDGLIKLYDPKSGSKKFAKYVPYWA